MYNGEWEMLCLGSGAVLGPGTAQLAACGKAAPMEFSWGVGNVHWGMGNAVPGEWDSARPQHRTTCCMREGCAGGILHGEWEMCPGEWERCAWGVWQC